MADDVSFNSFVMVQKLGVSKSKEVTKGHSRITKGQVYTFLQKESKYNEKMRTNTVLKLVAGLSALSALLIFAAMIAGYF